MVQMMQIEINKVVSELRQNLRGLGERADCLEGVADELISAQNVTDHEIVALKAQISTLTEVLEDTENCARRINLSLRNIPETVLAEALEEFVRKLFQTLLPDITEEKLLLDRVHRALGPKQPDPNKMRDAHYYMVKEAIMQASRSKP
ncbi:hypothetical protein FKM82_014849 [Ascaphus truei]